MMAHTSVHILAVGNLSVISPVLLFVYVKHSLALFIFFWLYLSPKTYSFYYIL